VHLPLYYGGGLSAQCERKRGLALIFRWPRDPSTLRRLPHPRGSHHGGSGAPGTTKRISIAAGNRVGLQSLGAVAGFDPTPAAVGTARRANPLFRAQGWAPRSPVCVVSAAEFSGAPRRSVTVTGAMNFFRSLMASFTVAAFAAIHC